MVQIGHALILDQALLPTFEYIDGTAPKSVLRLFCTKMFFLQKNIGDYSPKFAFILRFVKWINLKQEVIPFVLYLGCYSPSNISSSLPISSLITSHVQVN